MRQRDRNRENADRAFETITGATPQRESVGGDLQAQRRFVAERVREILDRGYSPFVLIEMLIAGAAWLGDQHGVSREQMARALTQVSMGEDRSLIYTPGGG